MDAVELIIAIVIGAFFLIFTVIVKTNARNPEVQLEKIKKMKDGYELKNYSITTIYPLEARKAAIDKIRSQTDLEYIFSNTSDNEIRNYLITKITDLPLLYKISPERYLITVKENPEILKEEILKIAYRDKLSYDLSSLRYEISEKQIIEICSNFTEREKERIFRYFKILDGKIFKTKCDFGEHQYEFIRSRQEKYTYHDGDDFYYQTERVYRCKECGEESII